MFGVVPRMSRAIEDTKEEAITEKFREQAVTDNFWRRRDLAIQVQENLRRYENDREGLMEGKLVWVRNFGRRKFEPRWLGPNTIVEVRKNSVKIKGENVSVRVVNRGDIKPYRPEVAPDLPREEMLDSVKVSAQSSSQE